MRWDSRHPAYDSIELDMTNPNRAPTEEFDDLVFEAVYGSTSFVLPWAPLARFVGGFDTERVLGSLRRLVRGKSLAYSDGCFALAEYKGRPVPCLAETSCAFVAEVHDGLDAGVDTGMWARCSW
jgi:hypothetical protein